MRTNAHSITALLIVITLISVVPLRGVDKETEVRATIEEFYQAFHDGFTQPAEFATEDWNHISRLEDGRADEMRLSKRFVKSTKPS